MILELFILQKYFCNFYQKMLYAVAHSGSQPFICSITYRFLTKSLKIMKLAAILDKYLDNQHDNGYFQMRFFRLLLSLIVNLQF